jgi:cysteine desulfurase
MLPYFSDHFGNAASHTHSYGWAAKEATDIAREQAAQLIGAEPGEIVFTSGSTEAINLALKGVFELYRSKGNHIITCVTEHKAVLDTCKAIERAGGRITYLPVDTRGAIDPGGLANAVTSETVLVSLMYANNETGYIHPIGELSRIVHEKGSLFFSDMTQAAGKVPLDVRADGIDAASFSAHKIYGPKGTGALYLSRRNPRVRVQAQMDGGGHEHGFRSGTLNVPGIAGFGKACTLCLEQENTEAERLGQLRDRLEQETVALGEVGVNGDPARRLAHVTNLAFGGVNGRELITALSGKVAVSSGSACTSALPEPSHVLLSMGLSEALAKASLRFSLGRFTTAEEVDFVIRVLQETIPRVRRMS